MRAKVEEGELICLDSTSPESEMARMSLSWFAFARLLSDWLFDRSEFLARNRGWRQLAGV